MNFMTSQVLRNVDVSCRAIRMKYAEMDRAERKISGNGHGNKSPKDSPLEEAPRGKKQLIDHKNSRGPDARTRAIAFASDSRREDMEWDEISKETGVPKSRLKPLVAAYERHGGQTDGTLLRSGELSLHAVIVLSKRLHVKAPCDKDLARWAVKHPEEAYFLSDKKDWMLKRYALSHGIIQENLHDRGFSKPEVRRAGMLVGTDLPGLDDITTFFVKTPDKNEQDKIAIGKGIWKGFMGRLRKVVAVPDEQENVGHLNDLTDAASSGEAQFSLTGD